MNRSAGSITTTDDLGLFTRGATISSPAYSPSSFIHTPQGLPKRVYRVVLSRGVQDITCTSVATDEGFLKFYNVIPNQAHGFNTSVVAMIPAVQVQLVTSILEEDQVVV